MRRCRLGLWLSVVVAVLVAASAALIAFGARGDASVDLSSRNKQIEAARAAFLVMLQGMKSNRNALADIEAWSRSSHNGYRPVGVTAYKDLKFDDPLVPVDQMTQKEKLLVWGYPAGGDPAAVMMPGYLAMIAYSQYKFADRTVPDLLWMQNAPVMPLERLEPTLALRISPVTGKLIEVDCQEFSPGNAYVRIVSEDEVKELVKLDPIVDQWWRYTALSAGTNDPKNMRTSLTGVEMEVPSDEIVMSGKHPPVVVYLRIYGEKGVLVEGLF